MITPAISVLSAVEGLKTVNPALGSYVIPIAIGILVGLFAIQSRGTAKVGLMFAPIMNALSGFDQVSIDFAGRKIALALPKGRKRGSST